MWPFSSIKSLKSSGMLNGLIDHHSHILPGVDDGIPNLESALAVLRHYDEIGVDRVWLTPHIMEDIPNEPEHLQAIFKQLQTAWSGRVKIDLAAEHMLDSLFKERLKERRVLPIGKEKNHLLVETSYYTPPMGMENMLQDILKAGYFPILAHPERYRYMEESDYRQLRELGIFFQLNFLSVVGGYGEAARKKAEWLLAHDMIDIVGSDIHRLDTHLSMIEKSPKNKAILEGVVDIAHNPKLSL